MFVFFVLIFWSDFPPGWFLWVIIQFQHLLEMSLGTSVPLAPRVCPTGAFLGLPSVLCLETASAFLWFAVPETGILYHLLCCFAMLFYWGCSLGVFSG